MTVMNGDDPALPEDALASDAVDAARWRCLVAEQETGGEGRLGVFICDADGHPNDSMSSAELIEFVDAALGQA